MQIENEKMEIQIANAETMDGGRETEFFAAA